jgi:hypothetical protein
LIRSKPLVEPIAQQGGDNDCDLLAGGLPGYVKTLVPRGCHLGQVDRHAAKLDASREALQQASYQHQKRSRDTDRGIGRHERDQDRPHGHDRQRDNQAPPAADTIHIGAEHDGAQGSHQKSGAERCER